MKKNHRFINGRVSFKLSSQLNQFTARKDVRHYIRVVAYGVLGLSLGAFLVLQYQHFSQPPANIEPVTDTATTTKTYPSLPRALPVRLRIPELHIDTAFEKPLGLNADGTIQVPKSFDDVAWYEGGASPGEHGPATILGHVDSYKGAAVFYFLGQLHVGDKVYVDRADGTTATFTITGLERYKQDEFPTEKVYGKTPDSELRLITCTGVYNHGTLRYDHNLVVYGVLDMVQATSSPQTGTTTTSP